MRLADGPADRRASALLFGNRHKLELLAALAHAEDGQVNLSALADAHGVRASVYYGPIKDLIETGLVQRLAPTPRDRRRWYSRTESSLWACVRCLADELVADEVKAS